MEPIDLAKLLAENVARLMLRQSPPWTRAELSRRLDWNPANVTRLFRAERPPTAVTLTQLANVFGVEFCELLCGSTPATSEPDASPVEPAEPPARAMGKRK